MNFKYKILIVSLVLLFALSVSAVCAGENASDVQTTVEQNTSAVPADDAGAVESSNGDYDSGNDVVSVDSSKEELGATYTFKHLYSAVNTGSTNVDFGTSYVYSSSADTDIDTYWGVVITRSCVINGHGFTVDGGG